MKKMTGMIFGAGLGAGLMYLFDPERGNHRRTKVRDQANNVAQKTRESLDSTKQDMSNRVQGLRSEVRYRFGQEQMPDDRLAERITATVGRLVGHPGAVRVSVADSHVTLSGHILTDEAERLIKRVCSLRGVNGVDDQLQRHDDPGNIPALQGEPVKQSSSLRDGLMQKSSSLKEELMQPEWNSRTRMIAGAVGTTAALGLFRNGLINKVLGAVGLAVLTRSATNKDFKSLAKMAPIGRGVKVEKSITINVPAERVFALWSDPQRFPEFMSHVREVTQLDDQRWHWVITGPTGTETEFNTEFTAFEPDSRLAWRSEPDSLVQHEGEVIFESIGDDSTRVDVRMTYNPVAGAAGHAVATMLGSDPKSLMDDDLARLKAVMESGQPVPDSAALVRH